MEKTCTDARMDRPHALCCSDTWRVTATPTCLMLLPRRKEIGRWALQYWLSPLLPVRNLMKRWPPKRTWEEAEDSESIVDFATTRVEGSEPDSSGETLKFKSPNMQPTRRKYEEQESKTRVRGTRGNKNTLLRFSKILYYQRQ